MYLLLEPVDKGTGEVCQKGTNQGFDEGEWLFLIKKIDKITTKFSEFGAAFHGQTRLEQSEQLIGVVQVGGRQF